VLQSNYIPWRGYFDLIHDVDTFVFYDDVQYTKGDWRNRNYLKTEKGRELLSIPVGSRLDRKICEVAPADSRWQARHWKSITQYYARAPWFAQYRKFFEDFYLGRSWSYLSELNRYLIEWISKEVLGCTTRFLDSRSYELTGARSERLLQLLQRVGAKNYVSGPSARSYIDMDAFSAAGIDVQFKDYSGYPQYPQFYPPFIGEVSVLDLLFHRGPQSPESIWGWRDREPQ
jgi:hypothetical protein